MKISIRRCTRKSSCDLHLCKGKEKSGIRKKKMLSSSEVSTKVSANPSGRSDSGKALRVVSRWV